MCLGMYEERMRGTQASRSTQCFPADASFALQGRREGKEGRLETCHWYPDAAEGGSTCGQQPEQVPGREERVEQHGHTAQGWGMRGMTYLLFQPEVGQYRGKKVCLRSIIPSLGLSWDSTTTNWPIYTFNPNCLYLSPSLLHTSMPVW